MYKIDTNTKKINSNNDDEFVIPYEAACSPEFSQGCIIAEDETE